MAQLQFKGKTFVQNHHLLVKYHEFVPVKAKSLTDKVSLHDNLIIHGDNLKGLKALLPLFARKVKCVCIDPPYNTGNEGWAYNDNVNSPMMQDWLGKVVDREDLTRHDKWLCMMMPRLKLIRELMTDDGVIFVFIDDNEVHHLRMLMDEVFGENNFVATVVWQKRTSPEARLALGPAHDSIVVYAKSREFFNVAKLPLSERRSCEYKNSDNDQRGPWASVDLTGQVGHATPDQFYTVTTPSGRKIPPPKGRCWALIQSTFEQLMTDNRIWFGQDGEGRPRLKRFLSESEGTQSWTWWPHTEVGHNQEATKELNDIMGADCPFENPKPTRLLRRILGLVADKESLVLDSFAGSGTTAHAVLAQNAEDGGNRRFILIECEDYADTVTAERVRRVIKGVPTAKDEDLKKGLGGTFSFFKVGKAVELESILDGDGLPTYDELARYVFYTATGEEFDEKAVDEKKHFIGESRNYQVFLFYEPDVAKLKNLALTLDMAKGLPAFKPARHSPTGDGGKDKRRLVFAPTKYLDQEHLDQYRIDFAQLPFEIYELTR